jgi:hypothetical protein
MTNVMWFGILLKVVKSHEKVTTLDMVNSIRQYYAARRTGMISVLEDLS